MVGKATSKPRPDDADAKYLRLVQSKIDICKAYKPKFGQKGSVSLEQFKILYGHDAFYAWFGMDNPLLYAAHKAAGGITSLYRQIGLGCEHLFRQIVRDQLDLSADDVFWSYTKPNPGRKKDTKLTLDARIPISQIREAKSRDRISAWLQSAADGIGVDKSIIGNLTGLVFEVRQGYKSADSKRANADIANAGTAYSKGYLPVAVILSNQINEGIADAYKRASWILLRGVKADSPVVSTYAFMEQIIGYDLAGFFRRNSPKLKATVEEVLRALLAAETPKGVAAKEPEMPDELNLMNEADTEL
jgi:hypothetical protein